LLGSKAAPAHGLGGTAHLALKDNQLTSERGILSLKSADRSDRRNQQPQKEQEQRDHRKPTLRDSFTRSNGRSFQYTQVRHFWMCEVPHTLAWGYRASTRHAGCEMGCNQLMT
jgi:hypothetical protein